MHLDVAAGLHTGSLPAHGGLVSGVTRRVLNHLGDRTRGSVITCVSGTVLSFVVTPVIILLQCSRFKTLITGCCIS